MSRIIMQPSGKSVDCAYGDTVLMALEKAGYALPNNCRAGACGECKVKVTSGQFDQGMVLDMALSQEERRQGYGLMCMAKPISDELSIEWGTEDARPKLFPPPRRTPSSSSPTSAASPSGWWSCACARWAADPLLARPVRDAGQPARRHSGPRLLHLQRPAPRRRTGAAGGPRRWRRDQQLGSRQPGRRRKRQGIRRLRHLHRRPRRGHPGAVPGRRHRVWPPSWPSPKPLCGGASASR
jgi:ferredoxin